MAGKKPANANPDKAFWSPKTCAGCGKSIDTMKEANRVLVKDFTGPSTSKRFLWRHKLCV